MTILTLTQLSHTYKKKSLLKTQPAPTLQQLSLAVPERKRFRNGGFYELSRIRKNRVNGK